MELAQQEYQIPKIPKSKRIVPNDIARSSLFTVVNKSIKRDYFNDKIISSYTNCKVRYTGEEMRHEDQDVWMQIMLLSYKNNTLKVEFAPYTFIKSLGWPARPAYKDRLLSILTRLSSASVNVSNKEFSKGVIFSLVRKIEWIKEENSKKPKWVVHLEPEMLKLFGHLGKTYSYISWQERKVLKPLAKWLHAFYSTHACPDPINVGRIKDLCGSKEKLFRKFKSRLKEALYELVKIGFLKPDIYISPDNIIFIERTNKRKYNNYE